MALKHHSDDKVRFDQQVDNSVSYLVPFLAHTKPLTAGLNVMEVGTGEGGVLVPFMDAGCFCLGVDLVPERIELANQFLEKEVAAGKVKFVCQNIYEDAFYSQYNGFFDIIILKDVIEHVPNQEEFIPYLMKFLKPGGQIFFGFPPWYMPFGGHQQVCRKKWLSVLPYYHILPNFLYKGLLKLGGEHPIVIADLMEIKTTAITIERFERIIRKSGLKVLYKEHYLINPIYKYKFGLNPKKQWKLVSALPYVRDFLTTCVYYTVG